MAFRTSFRFSGDTTGTLGVGLRAYWPALESQGNLYDIVNGRVWVEVGTGHDLSGANTTAEGLWHVLATTRWYDGRNTDGFWPNGDVSFTVAVWIRALSGFVSQSSDIIGDLRNAAGNHKFLLQMDDPADKVSMRVSADGTNWTQAIDPTVLAIDTNYLCCGKLDASANVVAASVNGAAFTTAAHSTGLYTTAGDQVSVGHVKDQGNTGSIMRVGAIALWTKALTNAEISAYYNSGSGLSLIRSV